MNRHFAILFAGLLPLAAAVANEPYKASLWAQATYGADGRATAIAFPEKEKYSPVLLAHLEAMLLKGSIEPMTVDGKPGVFTTGVIVEMTVTPGAVEGAVQVDRTMVTPRILHRSRPRLSARLMASDWKQTVMARCTIDAKGRCDNVRLEAPVPGMPDQYREFARGWLAGWRFEPQTFNGEPVASEVLIPINVTIEDRP